jgi:hypothetical protein
MFNRTKNAPRKNPNATLAGGLPRRDTALPERDAAGQIIDYEERINELPSITAPVMTPEFGEQLRAYFQQAVKTCGLSARSAAEQYRNIVAALRLKLRGRFPTFEPQRPAERQKHQRERKKKYAWLPFELLSDDDYLVMERPRDFDAPLFDFRPDRFQILTGMQLRTELEAHSKAYGYPQIPEGVGAGSIIGAQFDTQFADEIPTVVLVYPDHIRYFIPDIRNDYSEADVLAGKGGWSLNQGILLKQAPHGLGKLISGWREHGLSDKSGFGFEDMVNACREDFANFNDGQRETGEPEDAKPYESEQGFADVVDRQHSEETEPDDLSSTIWAKAQREIEALQPTCKLCHKVLEYDPRLAIAHLETEHPEEYGQLRREISKWIRTQRKEDEQRKQRLAEKQKHCRENHERMLVGQLEQHQQGPFYCGKCGTELCRHQHMKMIEEELQRREAYIISLPYQEHKDARKAREKTISCPICHKYIYVTQYEG